MTEISGEAIATTPALLRWAAEHWPDLPYFEDMDTGAQVTFGTMRARVMRAAAAFLKQGIQPGDRIAIWAPNSVAWVVAAIGLHSVGAALIPLNTRLKGGEAAYILARSNARMLVTVRGFLGIDYPAMLAGHALPDLKRIVLLEGAKSPEERFERFVADGDAVDPARVEAAARAVTPETIADIMFTSGTTGQPKGVIAAHGQNVKAYRAWIERVGLQHRDRILLVNPFFHAFGYKAGWLSTMIVGGTVIPMTQLEAEPMRRFVIEKGVTVVPGPPTIFQSLLALPEAAAHPFPRMRLAVTGAASVPPSLIEQMKSTLGIKEVVTGYGLTESCGIVSMCRRDDSVERIALTCGIPIGGVEVKVVGEDGATLPADEAGEILVRGYNVMKGYLDDPQATAEAIDKEGWLHTGDVGTVDAEGYIRITDRAKDMYITGGFNCYPAEIERMMAAHPAIAYVAITGVPDERLGEVGRAHVVLKPGTTLSEAELIAWSRENMANYKVPRSIRFAEQLPMTASGKVQHFALKGL